MADKKLNVDLTATDNASAKINKAADAADALDKMSPTVDVGADVSAAQSALDGLSAQINAFDGPIGDVGTALGKLASPQGAIAGLAGGLLLAGDHAADLAIEADNLANLTGDSVENASRLNSVWKQSGADAKDLQDVLLQMGGVLTTNTELTKQLGVDLADGKSLGERFAQVVDLVGKKYDDAAQRSVIMSQLFGEEGVRQVNAVISQVGDLGDAIDAVPSAAVVSDDDVAQAREYKEQLTEFKVQASAFAQAIGEEVLPMLTEAARLAKLITDGFALPGKNFFGDADDGGGFKTRIEETTGATKNYELAAGVAADTLGRLEGGVEAVTDAVIESSQVKEREIEVTKRLSDADREARDGAMEGLAEWNAKARETYEANAAAAEGMAQRINDAASTIDTWATVNANEEDSYEDYLANKNDALANAAEFVANLETIVAAGGQSVANELIALGPEAGGRFAAELVSGSEVGLQQAIAGADFRSEAEAKLAEQLAAAGEGGGKALRAALAEQTKTAATLARDGGDAIGEEMATAIVDAADRHLEMLNGAGRRMAGAVIAGARAAMQGGVES